MSKKTYDSSDIKVLEELEHIRTNSSMYIGSTNDPTHLVEEALDNALDECQAGYAKIVAVIVDTKTNRCQILDSGRGIPIDNDAPITIATKLFSSGKFKGKKTVYDVSAGRNGVGVCCITALSTNFEIDIFKDDKHAHYAFENSKFKIKDIKEHTGQKPFSTKLSFIPDPKIFENLLPNIDRIRNRLLVASINFEDCTFVLQIDDKKEIIKISKEDFYKKHVLTEQDTETTDIFKFSVVDKPEKLDVWFSYSYNGGISPRNISSVNILPVEGGGTHVSIFQDILKNIFMAKGKKLNASFLPQDILCGLRSYISLSIKEPDFSGQTKYKLDNRRSYFETLENKLKSAIEKWASENDEQITFLIEHFNTYRKRLNSKKLKTNTDGRRGSTKFTKLRDCALRGGELFITEGTSASGNLIKCRDPSKHAILPLKGKIPSIVNKKDILKNDEVKEIINALGTGIEDNFDINKLRYDKIICATDADADGGHIFCLITILLATLVPELIKQGKYFLGMTPLYAISEKNIFIPIWDEESLNKAVKEKRNIERYKGLGEANPWQLKKMLIDDDTRRLVPIKYTKNIEELTKIFSSSDIKRELLMKDILNE